MFDTLMASTLAYYRAHPDELAHYGADQTPAEGFELARRYVAWERTTPPLEQSTDATAPAAGADPIPEGLPGRTDTLLDGQARRDCPTTPWGACITVLDSHPRFDAHPL